MAILRGTNCSGFRNVLPPGYDIALNVAHSVATTSWSRWSVVCLSESHRMLWAGRDL